MKADYSAGKKVRRKRLSPPALLLVALIPALAISQPNIQRAVLKDGVERWQRVKAQDARPWFFQQVENLFNVVLPSKEKLPFGESVAFLVGVSQYDHLTPQLPFVKNDVADMRAFLLDKGGFDTVYVAHDKAATRKLIADYMTNKFRASLGKRDRLLFYYSGHGADLGGITGYMQFSQAQKDDFSDHVLPIKDCMEWSRIIPAGHVLFIYDCCSSGLALTPRSGETESLEKLLSTISGNGSRAVITAGTANEKTYEIPDQHGKGNGVFTRALLEAMERGAADKGSDGFMTMNEIFAQAEIGVKNFAAIYGKALTPRRWDLQENEFRGTFIFVNPEAKARKIALPAEYAQQFNARARGEAQPEYGMLQLISYLPGKVFIDGEHVDDVRESGDSNVYDLPVGAHKIVVQGAGESVSRSVTVAKGSTTTVTIRPKETRTATKVPEVIPAKTTPRFSLRATPEDNLSAQEAKAMLKQRDFYCVEYDWTKEWSNPKGNGLPNDFELQHDGKVIFDRATGLMWQQSGSPNSMTFADAEKYLRDLRSQRFAGYEDWRLPTLEEAMSLMEPKELNGNLYIDAKFDNTQWWIWTADKSSAGVAWVVLFDYGYCYLNTLLNRYYVRAVR